MPIAKSKLYDVRVYFHKPFYSSSDGGDVVSVNHRVVSYPQWLTQEPYYLLLLPFDTDDEVWIMAHNIAYITIKPRELDDSGNVITDND